MKQASMTDEACFMCQRSLLHWSSRSIAFFRVKNGYVANLFINKNKV